MKIVHKPEEKTNKKAVITIILLALMLIVTLGASKIALDHHYNNEQVKDAQIVQMQLLIDSLQSNDQENGWYTAQWTMENDSTSSK